MHQSKAGNEKGIVRLFGQHMRCYMLAYCFLHEAKQRQTNGELLTDEGHDIFILEMYCSLVEQIVSVHKIKKKIQRNVGDQEKSFIGKWSLS